MNSVRRNRLNSTVISLHFFIQLTTSQSCQTGFAPYPACAIQYLCDAVPAQCQNLDGTSATDECLCSNINFMTNSALGIYANCGCDALTKSAVLRASVCNEYAPDVPVTVEEYIAAGDGGQSSCASSSTFTTSTTASTSSSIPPVSANIAPLSTPITEPASQYVSSAFSSQPTTLLSLISTSSFLSFPSSTTSSIPSSTTTATNGPDHAGGTGLSAGAMAGIAIGGLVAAVISALVALDKWFQKKRHRRLFQVLCGSRRPIDNSVEK